MKSIYSNEDFFLIAIKNPWYKLLLEIQNIIIESTVEYYRKKNVKGLLTPTTTLSVSSPMGLGSDSTPVEVELDGRKIYLSDSMQFLLEYGCRFHSEGCYSLSPSYRGENPDKRHLSQFFHSEAEFPGDMDSALLKAELYLKYLANKILIKLEKDLLKVTKNVNHIKKLINDNSIPQITFDEAIKLLGKSDYIINDKVGYRYLTQHGEKKLIDSFDGFVWVTAFDHLSIPFYQAFGKNPSVSKSADLLLGMGEIIGLGERHRTSKELVKALRIHNISPDRYKWYIELKKNHPLQTSGYGMGVERFICWILNHDDIRDVQLFIRFKGETNTP